MIPFRLFVRCIIALLVVGSANAKNDSGEIYRAVYEGKFSGWNVEMTRTLSKQADGAYVFSSVAKNMFASISETSTFTIDDHATKPLSYLYARKVFGRKARESIDFNWQRKVAFYGRSDRPQNNTEHPIQDHYLDPSLYQLMLQTDLFHNNLSNGKKVLTYDFIKRKQIKHYRFEFLKEGELKLQDRSYKSTVVVREDEDKSKRTEVWVVPELDYQIARIEHTDGDGDTYKAELVEYRVQGDKLRKFYSQLAPSESPALESAEAANVQ